MAVIRGRGEKGTKGRMPGEQPGFAGREGGFAMLFVIFTIMVVGILGALVLLYTSYALRNAVGVTPASRAQTAAESGLDVVHAMLASGKISESVPSPGITGTLWGGKGSYTVTVQKNPETGDGDPYDWQITSSGEYTTAVEGVQRTFYRTLEEVITFAGGRYYNALNYVLFSKEGNININLDGDLGAMSIGQCTINGDIYAGRDVILADAARFIGSNTFAINGDVITEKGDITARNSSIFWSSSKLSIAGSLYSGILATPGSTGGGVNFETSMGLLNGNCNIEVIGEINSHGRLRDYDYGVRFDNSIGAVGTATTRIAGNIKSNKDVLGQNRLWLAGTTNIQIDGTINSGEDVSFSSELAFAGTMNNLINGSVYAAGNVNLYADGSVWGTMQNRVGGDIQAQGDVDIYHHFWIGCGNPSGYVVGGSVYGRSVKLDSSLGAVGSLSNSVGGNVYCNGGGLDIDNYASLGTSTVNIAGSVYTTGNVAIDTDTGLWASAPLNVKGSIAWIPPGLGCYSGGSMTLDASDSSSRITVTGNAKQSSGTPSIPHPSNVTITGATSPAVGSFGVTKASNPTPPTDYNEVLLPTCDFDYYREMAKGQEAVDGKDHYYESSVADLDIPAGMITTSLYVVFVEGDLGIGTVNVPVDCTGVFVATGNIKLREEMRKQGAGDAEFQIISGGKVTYETAFNMALDDNDRLFIYAGDKDYNPVSNPVSVRYQMGWSRGIYGQITARGDVVLESDASKFKTGLYNHSITYKSPAVLGEAFRIPFKIKTWKEL